MSSRTDEDQLVLAVRNRAHDPSTRTDYASERRRDLPAPATLEVIHNAEDQLGFLLNALHRRLLAEVADGGFGPGDGIVGLGAGGFDAHGRSLIQLREVLWLDANTPLPLGVVPLCDWGDAIWSCVDAKTGHILTLDESGLTDTGQNLYSWLADWTAGINIFGKMFTFEEITVINPFTKQPMTVTTPSRALGTPYQSTG